MANVVGQAVLRIVGDSGAFEATIRNLGNQTGGALERGAQGFVARADDIGARFGERVGEAASRTLKRVLLGAVVGIGAAIGATLVAGSKRFTTIEDATASLTLQLGDAAAAGKLLGNVLKTVEGTPFALDQFVDAARNLVAAGLDAAVVPGILSAIGDAAAAAGGSAEDVDSIVNSFARMATSATLTLGPVRELEEKGIPALRILANQFGVTVSQMTKDITAGTIDSEKAIALLTSGIVNGTAAVGGLGSVSAETQQKIDDLAQGVEDANARLGDLRDNVTGAKTRLGDLARELDKARQALDEALLGPSAADLKGASLAVERAKLREKEAINDVEDAEDELKKARKGGDQEEIERAELKLKEARLSVEEASLRIIESEERLNEVKKEGTEEDEKVIAAREKVRDVTRQIADANKDLEKAQRAAAKGARDVAKADRELAGAQAAANKEIEATSKGTIAFGGAALAIGNTLAGAFGNLRTAVARAGAKIIDVFAKSGENGKGLVLILNRVRETVDILGGKSVEVAKRIISSDGFGRVLDFFEKLPNKLRTTKGGLDKALLALFDVTNFSELLEKALDGIERAFTAIPDTKLGSVISTVIVRSIEATTQFLPVIIAAVIKIAPEIIAAVLQGLVQAATDNPLDFALFIGALGIPGVAPALAGFFRALPFGTIVAPLISGLGRAITFGFAKIGLGAAFAKLGAKFALEMGLLSTRIGLLGLRLAPVLSGAITAALNPVVIAVAIGALLGVVLHLLIERFAPGINRFFERVGASIFDFFADKVFPFFSKTIPSFFTRTIPKAVGIVVDFFAKMPGRVLRGIQTGFVSVLDFFKNLPGRIFDILKGMVQSFIDLGTDIMEGFFDGIIDTIGRLASKLPRFIKRLIPDRIKDFFGISSPSRLMFKLGEQIGDGLRLGLLGSLDDIDIRQRVAAIAQQTELARLGTLTQGSPGSSARTASGVTIQQMNLHTTSDDPEELALQFSNRIALKARRR